MKIGDKVIDTLRTKEEIMKSTPHLMGKKEIDEGIKLRENEYSSLKKLDTSKFLSKQEMFDRMYKEGSEVCIITNITETSVEVQHFARTTKGIDCTNWYSLNDFNKRFKII